MSRPAPQLEIHICWRGLGWTTRLKVAWMLLRLAAHTLQPRLAGSSTTTRLTEQAEVRA